MADGYYLMLAPLSPGNHTITFGGNATFPDGSSFKLDITCNLTIAP